MFEASGGASVPYAGPFDGFTRRRLAVEDLPGAVRQQQVLGDGERGRPTPVEVRAYAERIVSARTAVVGEHPPSSARPDWSMIPALCAWLAQAGAPRQRRRSGLGFARLRIERVRRKLKSAPDGDRQMVILLGGADRRPAGGGYCAEALKEGVHSADVILNILSRRRDPGNRRRRSRPPRRCGCGASRSPIAPVRQPQEGERMMERSEIMTTMGDLKLFGMRPTTRSSPRR